MKLKESPYFTVEYITTALGHHPQSALRFRRLKGADVVHKWRFIRHLEVSKVAITLRKDKINYFIFLSWCSATHFCTQIQQIDIRIIEGGEDTIASVQRFKNQWLVKFRLAPKGVLSLAHPRKSSCEYQIVTQVNRTLRLCAIVTFPFLVIRRKIIQLKRHY